MAATSLRVCARCREAKTLDEFYEPPKSYCRVCSRKMTLAWRAKYPGRRKAHTEVARALRNGVLIRPSSCSKCGAHGPVAHHENYNKPLDVVWLCDTCHARRHVELRRSRPQTPRPKKAPSPPSTP